MTSNYASQISRLEKEIAALDKEAAAASKKEADLIGRKNRARDSLNRATSISTANSASRKLEEVSKSLAAIKNKQSDLSAKRARKISSLLDYQRRQARTDETARKKIEKEQRKLMADQKSHQRRMALEAQRQDPVVPTESIESANAFDFFICHASEDKEDLVRDLADLLKAGGAKVWYDEFALRVGSRLRREIDRGLATSRFGIVVVSPHFFAKEWAQRELDGLFSLETQENVRILPIWHKVTKDEVARHSQTLADIVALNTGIQGTQEIADQLLELIS